MALTLDNPRGSFRADIQGLRGLAVLLVVAYHAGLPVPGGYTGVDVFFVLSGFVITAGLQRGLAQGEFSFRTFYAKRVRRLLPALALVLTVVLLLAPVLGPLTGLRGTGRTGVAAVLLNANHYLYLGGSYFDTKGEYNALLHTWSLSVEEQFYLVFPLVTFALWRLGSAHRAPTRLLVGLSVFSLVSFVFCVVATFTPTLWGLDGPRVAFYTAPARAWEFGLGALVAVASPWFRRHPRLSTPLAWVGAGLVTVGAALLTRTSVFPGTAALLPALGTTLLLLPGLHPERASLLRRALEARWLTRIGDLSYSWYLWHWPAIVFAVATVPDRPVLAAVSASVVSLGLAWLTERFVETPIRFRPRASRRPVWQVGALSVVVPLLAFAGLTGAARVFPAQGTLAREVVDSARAYRAIGCDRGQTLAELPSGCVWGDGGAWSVVLVGDSNARQYIPALREVVPRLDGALRATTRSNCPFVLGATVLHHRRPDPACAAWITDVLHELEADPPDVIVVAHATDVFATRPWATVGDASGADASDHPETKRRRLADGTAQMVERLVATGAQVVLMEPIPRFLPEGPRGWFDKHADAGLHAVAGRCSVTALAGWPHRCQLQRSVDADARWLSTTAGAELFAPSYAAGAVRVVPADALCPDHACRAFDHDPPVVWYHDIEHVAPDGARRMMALFDLLFRELRAAASP